METAYRPLGNSLLPSAGQLRRRSRYYSSSPKTCERTGTPTGTENLALATVRHL